MSRTLDRFTVALFCGGEPYLRPDLGEIIAVTPLAGDGALRLTLAAPLLRRYLDYIASPERGYQVVVRRPVRSVA